MLKRERSLKEQQIVNIVEDKIRSILMEYSPLYDVEVLTMDEAGNAAGYIRLQTPPNAYIYFKVENQRPEFIEFQLGNELWPASRSIIKEILDHLFATTYKEGAEKKEVIKSKKIPEKAHKLIKRPSVRKQMPASCFLMPKERKFPICDPIKKKPHCGFIRAAITRAAQWKSKKPQYAKIEEKARRLYEKHCKKKASLSWDVLKLASELLDFRPKYSEVADIIDALYDLGKYASAREDNISSSYYLNPENQMYIYRNPITGEIDTALLYASMKRAAEDGDIDAYWEGQKLYKKAFVQMLQDPEVQKKLLYGTLGLAALGAGLYGARHLWYHSPSLRSAVIVAKGNVMKIGDKTKNLIDKLFGKKKESWFDKINPFKDKKKK